jgi:hypothetical protein
MRLFALSDSRSKLNKTTGMNKLLIPSKTKTTTPSITGILLLCNSHPGY